MLLGNSTTSFDRPPKQAVLQNGTLLLSAIQKSSYSGTLRCRSKSEMPMEHANRKQQRPAVIEEDLVQMERRKRVREVLHAKDFCDELNEIMSRSYSEDFNQPLPEIFPPPGQMPFVNLASKLPRQVLPICDIPCASSAWSKQEISERSKLAALYRLCDLFQWSQGIYNHVTLRLSPEIVNPEILINPFGLLYNEISASSLIKITLKGDVLDPGTTNLGINQAGYVLHSAIHEARPDVCCVLHLHTAVVSAVSSMKCGLLPICQEAMIIGPVAYHDYKGIVSDDEEKESIVRDLGDKNVMILRNHGFVACGQSVEDAFHLSFHTVIACETQIRAIRAGLDQILVPSEESVLKAYKTARRGGGGVNQGSKSSWGIGELEWEAWMRLLDSAGYRTGHHYKHPQLRASHTRNLSDAVSPRCSSMFNLSSVALPPAVTPSLGVFTFNFLKVMSKPKLKKVCKSSPSIELPAHRATMARIEQDRARWISSALNYQRIRFFQSGTENSKMYTKWITTENNGAGGSSVKIDSHSQFAPLGTNSNEFQERRQQMKDRRQMGITSGGPQSQLLQNSGAVIDHDSTHQRAVLIGAASKGIIDKRHQYNAQVYSQIYAPNPFASATDGDLKRYMVEIEHRSRSTSELTKIPSKEHVTKKQNGMAKNKVEFVETPKNKPPHPTLATKQNKKVEKMHSENKGNPDSAIKDNLRNKTKLKRFFSLNKKRT